MLEEGKITRTQLMLLVITVILASAILLLPSFTAKEALQDSWISGLIAMLAGLLTATIILALAKRFPEQTPVEYSITILGKPLGKLMGLLYLIFFVHLTAILLREISTTVITTILPRTPIQVTIAISTIAMAYLIRKGLETIARVNIIMMPISLFFVVTIFLLATPAMKVENITPILENGVMPIFKGAITPVGWFGEVVSMAFLLPFVNKLPKAKKPFYLGILFSGLVFTFVIIGSISVFGPDITKNTSFPTLAVAREVNLANFLERIESLLIATWIIWNFIKTGVFYYISVLILSQWLKLDNYRPVVFPMGIIIALVAEAFFMTSIQLSDFLAKVYGIYASIFELLIPGFLFIVALLRRKKAVTSVKK